MKPIIKFTFELVLLRNLLMRGAAADEIHLVHLGQARHGGADRVGQSEVHLGLSAVGLPNPGLNTYRQLLIRTILLRRPT